MEETQATIYWIKKKLETKMRVGIWWGGKSRVQKCRNGQRYLPYPDLGSDV